MPIFIESLDRETTSGDLAIADSQLGLTLASPSAETLAERGLVSWELSRLMSDLSAEHRYVIEGVAGLLRSDGEPTATLQLARDLRVKVTRVDQLVEEARSILQARILDSAIIDFETAA